MNKLTFGFLLKQYRKRSGLRTLREFADALADEGLVYSESILSRWQKDLRLPSDRKVFLIILKVFITYGAITNIYQANQLISIAGKGFLSDKEVRDLLVNDDLKLTMNLNQKDDFQKDEEKLVRISLVLPNNMDKYLDWLSSQYEQSKAETFRNIIDKKIEKDLYQTE